MVYANLIKEKVLDFYWQGFSYTTHCHNWLHAVPWWKNRISRPTKKNHKYTVNHLFVQRLRNNNVSSDPSRKGLPVQLCPVLHQPEVWRWREIGSGSRSGSIWHLSPRVPHDCWFQKIVSARQLFCWWTVEGGLVSLLLGTSLLSEFMYPIIPFHALPYSLSLSREKNFPWAQVHCCSEERQQNEGDTVEVVSAYGFMSLYNVHSCKRFIGCRWERSPPSGSTGKHCPPPPLPFWKINMCIVNAFKNH